MPLTGRKRDKERDGRERWLGRNGFTSVHVRNLWHQCSDATAAKIHSYFYLTCMYVPSLYNPRWDGIVFLGVKLAGWVLLLPHPVQDQKKNF